MSAAFCCDLCDEPERGAPAQKIAITPALGTVQHLELCCECLASFNEWRVSRAPEQDKPQPTIDLPTTVDVEHRA